MALLFERCIPSMRKVVF